MPGILVFPPVAVQTSSQASVARKIIRKVSLQPHTGHIRGVFRASRAAFRLALTPVHLRKDFHQCRERRKTRGWRSSGVRGFNRSRRRSGEDGIPEN
jgi:hypothetical protein